MARSMGGGVNYWMELPMWELLAYMFELADQIKKENEEAMKE